MIGDDTRPSTNDGRVGNCTEDSAPVLDVGAECPPAAAAPLDPAVASGGGGGRGAAGRQVGPRGRGIGAVSAVGAEPVVTQLAPWRSTIEFGREVAETWTLDSGV
jgi:hypothetical protein